MRQSCCIHRYGVCPVVHRLSINKASGLGFGGDFLLVFTLIENSLLQHETLSCCLLVLFLGVMWHKQCSVVLTGKKAVCKGSAHFNKLQIFGTWNICSNSGFCTAQNFSFN